MSPLEVFLPHLIGGLLPIQGDPDKDSARMQVTDLNLALPIETRLCSSGGIDLCLPRGRMQTGFSLPHGRLTLRLQGAI